MKTIVLVLCSVSLALTAKEETPRKSRQVYGQVLHPGNLHTYDYDHPTNIYSSPLQYVQPAVPTLGLTQHGIIPQLGAIHPSSQIPYQQGPYQLAHGNVYDSRYYFGQLYGNRYNPGYTYAHLAHAQHGYSVPEIHPITERTIDLPTPTPLYGLVRPSHHGGSSYHHGGAPTPQPFVNPYHHTTSHSSRNLASLAPYTFPPTYPSSHSSSFYTRQYGSQSNLYSANNGILGSTPPTRVTTQITSAISPSNEINSQGGRQQGNQQSGARYDQTAVILSQSGEIRNDGSYDFGFQSDNGIRTSESGRMRPVGSEMAPAVQGAYSYTAPDGTPISASYLADETGFHVQGAHIPTASGAVRVSTAPNPPEQQAQQRQRPPASSSQQRTSTART